MKEQRLHPRVLLIPWNGLVLLSHYPAIIMQGSTHQSNEHQCIIRSHIHFHDAQSVANKLVACELSCRLSHCCCCAQSTHSDGPSGLFEMGVIGQKDQCICRKRHLCCTGLHSLQWASLPCLYWCCFRLKLYSFFMWLLCYFARRLISTGFLA